MKEANCTISFDHNNNIFSCTSPTGNEVIIELEKVSLPSFTLSIDLKHLIKDAKFYSSKQNPIKRSVSYETMNEILIQGTFNNVVSLGNVLVISRPAVTQL